jgi:hypothetical protein
VALREGARNEREQRWIDAHLRQRHPRQRELVREDLRQLRVAHQPAGHQDLAQTAPVVGLIVQHGVERLGRHEARLHEELSERGAR